VEKNMDFPKLVSEALLQSRFETPVPKSIHTAAFDMCVVFLDFVKAQKNDQLSKNHKNAHHYLIALAAAAQRAAEDFLSEKHPKKGVT
jgi:hypothetical protein